MTHILAVIGFIIVFGIAGRYDLDVAQHVTTPSMIWWLITSIALIIPEGVWLWIMVNKAKESEE